METNKLIQQLEEGLTIYSYNHSLCCLIEDAMDKLKELQDKLDEAEKDIQRVLWEGYGPCNLCKHHYPCEYMDCDGYEEGVGMTDKTGKYYDWKWSCLDFDYGTCEKLKNTPCNGCDLINHVEWKGR